MVPRVLWASHVVLMNSKHLTNAFHLPGTCCSFIPMRGRRCCRLLQCELHLQEVSEHTRVWKSHPQRRGHRWTSFLACSNYVLVYCQIVDLFRKTTFGMSGSR